MDFEQLKETLPDAKPQTFLQAILSQPQEEDAELTFSEEIDELLRFYQKNYKKSLRINFRKLFLVSYAR